MELIIISVVSILLILVLANIFKVNVKKIEEIGMEEKLNKLAEKYPENIEICKDILKKLNNENVKIEEDKQANATLYIAVSDKIFIANTKNSYTRIQTMAHECLHSVQDKKTLMFNFIFSNFYIIYFWIIVLLTIFKVIQNSLLYLNIFLLLSMTYYMVRIFLENDAMIKAQYLAKEYMEEKNLSTKEEINEIVEGFKRLNDVGIKYVNYKFLIEILIKVIIFSIVALIF
jgi:Ni/Fe-hydrogenase subunit HybB-like protein